MAELERADQNDEGRAREWLARALHAAPDPQWTADGHVSDRWLPVSPVTGRLDAFEWRVPLTGMISAPVIEPEPAETEEEIGAEQAQIPSRQSEPAPPPRAHEERSAPAPAALAPPARRQARRTTPKAEPVIPLVHAPDDPGPEDSDESEPLPAPQNGGWRKILE
jgi:HemY protein